MFCCRLRMSSLSRLESILTLLLKIASCHFNVNINYMCFFMFTPLSLNFLNPKKKIVLTFLKDIPRKYAYVF